MIGEKLKELRKAKGLTISNSAEIFGIASRTYSSYESEEREPNLTMLNKFADFYGVSVDYLLGRSEPKKEKNSHEILNDEIKEAYISLPKEVRAQILQAMLNAVISYNTDDTPTSEITQATTIGNMQDLRAKRQPNSDDSEEDSDRYA